MSSFIINKNNEVYVLVEFGNFRSFFLYVFLGGVRDSDLSCLKWGICEYGYKERLVLIKLKIVKLIKDMILMYKIYGFLFFI